MTTEGNVLMSKPLIVSIPPFRVTGTMHLLPTEGNLRAALSELQGRFLPITDATFWSDHVGEPRQQAVLVAVNHKRAQILAPHKVRDPWAGIDDPAGAAGAQAGAGAGEAGGGESGGVGDRLAPPPAPGAELDPWRIERPPER